jgi:hypothetical protein
MMLALQHHTPARAMDTRSRLPSTSSYMPECQYFAVRLTKDRQTKISLGYASRMGIHVHLAIVVERVSETTWQHIYKKACRTAASWTPAPLSLTLRDIGVVRVAQYTPDIENPDGLHIVGDAKTLTTGESFIFPVTLGGRRHNHSESVEPGYDVLVAVARRNASATQQLPYGDLFGAKTQGFPYHTLIVALGLLVEHLLPGTAVVYGDMSMEDGEQARDGLAAILDEEVALPVVLEEKRIRQRLVGAMDGDALEEALGELVPVDMQLDPDYRAVMADLLGALNNRPGARVRHELEHVVLSCSAPDLLAAETRRMFRELVVAIRSCMARNEIRHRVEQWGAARTLEELADRTLRCMRLTSRTWDFLEAADLDELAFVYTAICMDDHEWHLHHALRAVVENRALRLT